MGKEKFETRSVYLGLGANIGEPLKTLKEAVEAIGALPEVSSLQVSRYYQTSPVSDTPQNDYINAVCCLETMLAPKELLGHLQHIERRLGKVPKAKSEPRCIDIDILLFGRSFYFDDDLEIPHPRFLERLFVLRPLLDLTTVVEVPDSAGSGIVKSLDLREYLKDFPNIHHETVVAVSGGKDEKRSG